MSLNPQQSFQAFQKEQIEQSICSRFEYIVSKYSLNTAVSYQQKKISYEELNIKANQIARSIETKITDTDTPVALMMNQGIDLLATILGVLKSRNIYVPLDCRQPVQRIAPIINELKPGLIIYHSNQEFLVSKVSNHYNLLDLDEVSADLDQGNLDNQPDPHSVAYIYFTSGSTGKPKGVMDNHRNVLHNIMRYTNTLGIAPEDRLSLIQHSSFSGAVSSMFGALLNGATVCPYEMDYQRLPSISNWIQAERITIFHSVPSVFRYVALAGGNYETVRIIRLEGDRATTNHAKLFQEAFNKHCVLVNGLGATECGLVRQFFLKFEDQIDNEFPVGYEVQDMEVFIAEDKENPAEDGKAGEIMVRSKYLALGYWKDPEKTAKSFSDDEDGNRIYKTGDWGRMNKDQCLEYIGRKDRLVKVLGQMVNISELESVLNSISGVYMAVVRSYFDHQKELQLAAYLVLDQPASVSNADIRHQLIEQLPNYMIPKIIMIVNSLPLSSNGKIDYQSLPDPVFNRSNVQLIPPKTPLEKTLATIWSNVLGVNPIGVLDDFIGLGGDSLQAAQIINKLREKEISLNITDLFEHLNLRSIAKYLETKQSSGGDRLNQVADRAKRQLNALKGKKHTK